MIPRLDMAAIKAGDELALRELQRGIQDVGFLIVHNTDIDAASVRQVIAAYRQFFQLPEQVKQAVNMAHTQANRGWGAEGSEQVDPNANPDYKQVFDCGFELAVDDPLWAQELSVYADNQWPQGMADFRTTIQGYYDAALRVAMDLLRAIAGVIGRDATYFDDKFSRPMALLRGNFYPQRPEWAGEKDFGIATHTDYGCLTLLASDGVPGLEVRRRGGGWIPVTAEPGEFIINFGEMLQIWTQRAVIATPHRVRGTHQERISVPLFFNPNHDTNVAPSGATQPVLAGEYLARRFDETYLHLQQAD